MRKQTRSNYIRSHGGARRMHACDPGNWSLIIRDITWGPVDRHIRRKAGRRNREQSFRYLCLNDCQPNPETLEVDTAASDGTCTAVNVTVSVVARARLWWGRDGLAQQLGGASASRLPASNSSSFESGHTTPSGH